MATSPTPRGIALFSGTVPEHQAKVSTPGDQVAERVGFELSVGSRESVANAVLANTADMKLEPLFRSAILGRSSHASEARTTRTTSSILRSLSLPRFRGHPGSHGSAVGVCHGKTEASIIHR
jgi:hypothetical protein